MRTLILSLFAAFLCTAEDPRIEIRTSLGSIFCRLYASECPETVKTICDLAEGRRAFTDPKTNQEAKRPFYDGLTFHRVIPSFMIQGGCPLGTGTGGPGFAFKDEINGAALGLDKETVVQAEGPHPWCANVVPQFSQIFINPLLTARGLGPTSPRADIDKALPEILAQVKSVTLLQFYEKLGYAYDAKLPGSHRPVKGSLAMANSGPNTNGSQFFVNVADTPHLTGKHTVFGEVEKGQEVADKIANVPTDQGNKPSTPVTIIGIRVVGSDVAWPK